MSRQVSFNDRIRRLIRYRYPLLIAAALNGLFLVGVPVVRLPARTDAAHREAHRSERELREQPVGSIESATTSAHQTDGATVETSPLASVPSSDLTEAVRQRATGPRGSASSRSNEKVTSPERNRGLGRAVWQLGATAAAMSHWYHTAEKRDPFAESATNLAPAGPTPLATAPPNDLRAQQADTANPLETPESQASANTNDAPNGAFHGETGENEPGKNEVVLENRAASGFPVAFVARQRVYVLEPGAILRWVSKNDLPVSFDRGGDFGSVTRKLKPGHYVFSIGDQGWTLTPAKSAER